MSNENRIVPFCCAAMLTLVCCTSAANAETIIRSIDVPVRDIVYDPFSRKIYGSVPSSFGFPNGNSIVTIDPFTASIDGFTFAGSEPAKLALADDGSRLYVALNGNNTVRPFDLTTRTMGTPFQIGGASLRVEDMVVAPGHPNVVAVSRNPGGPSSNVGAAIFVDGNQLPVVTGGLINRLAFSNSAEVLYAHDQGTSFLTLSVDLAPDGGVTVVRGTGGVFRFWQSAIVFDDGRIYTPRGNVVDPVNHVPLGKFSIDIIVQLSFVSDSANNRTSFFLKGGPNGRPVYRVEIFDQPSFLLRDTITIPNETLSAGGHDLIRWGDQGFAIATDDGRVLLITSDLIGDVTGLASDLTGNGFIDFEDLTVLLANWNQDVAAAGGNLVDPATTPVNFEDLTVLLADWTGPGPAGSPEAALSAEAVPEPSTLLLALIAAFGLSIRLRRRGR